jgi:hypothetical protein
MEIYHWQLGSLPGDKPHGRRQVLFDLFPIVLDGSKICLSKVLNFVLDGKFLT